MALSKRIYIFFTFAVLLCNSLYAQSGKGSYTFLDLPYSASLAGLGGENVAMQTNDLSFSMLNPALLSDATHMLVQASYANLGGGLNFGTLNYGHNYKENRFAAGFHFLSYGQMQGADEYGNLTGTRFSASDYLINLSYARQLGSMFTVGVSLKPMLSFYESYSSFALGADVGGYFHTPDSTFQLGLTLRNIGWQLKTFYEETNKREMLPLDLALGLNYRFKHAPIRLGLTIHDLQRWNLNYQITNQPSSNNGFESETEKISWVDMMFRHTIFSVEIVPTSDKFYISLAYNHQRKRELQTGDGFSLSGFSLGAGVRIKQFRLAIAYAQYLRGQNLFQVSLACDINKFLK